MFDKSTTSRTDENCITSNQIRTKPFRGDDCERMKVPFDLFLKDPLKAQAENLGKNVLQPLNCSFGVVTTKEEPKPLRDLVRRQARRQRSDIVVAFAIRRPGCANCREHGLQLTEIAHQENVAMMGIVKESGATEIDENLCVMYRDYFRFPIFQDEKWKVFYAMGGRKLNMFKLIWLGVRSHKRYEAKGIANTPFGGDLLMQGGLLIFDKSGQLKYCYEEHYGHELDLQKLRAAIQGARCEQDRDSLATYFTDEASQSLSLSTTDFNTSFSSSSLNTWVKFPARPMEFRRIAI